ncbi:MAG TPA: hypothetical protein G4O03_04170 [Dehalococcoidia bacterium]|jgi:hypothetical protein|nr:hypothetical protein [Dehalococcoidia bacterium]
MAKKVTLHEEKILDDWSVVIEDAQGRGEEIYRETSRFIEESEAPGVEMETVKVRPQLAEWVFWKGEGISYGHQ